MSMTTSQQYEYQAYMSKGKDWERNADGYWNSNDFLTAKGRYFEAATAYENAERIANSANDYSASREASSAYNRVISAARECPYKYQELIDKQRKNDPYDKNYSPWR